MNHIDLSGRTAVITGGAQGIGYATAQRMLNSGARVVLWDRNPQALTEAEQSLSSQGAVSGVVVELIQEASVKAAAQSTLEQFGKVDILVNNAGGNSFMTSTETMRLSGWRKTLNLNLDALVALTQGAIPRLVNSGNGSIINVSSVAGVRGSPFMSHYGAAKAAVISFSRSLAIELASQGVRVNSLVPGWIETDLTDFLRTTQEAEAGALSRVPMGRWGRAEEIADAALFLASDSSSFMTGQELVIDGGLLAMP